MYRVIDTFEREVVNYLPKEDHKKYPAGRYLYLHVEDERWIEMVDYLYI